MSALARYFKSLGKNVAGYDKTPTTLTSELTKEGIQIHFQDEIEQIPQDFRDMAGDAGSLLVVYTPAVPKDHKGLNYFKSQEVVLMKRAEVLGLITKDTYTIAVAGTHGKTTTSSIIAHLLTHAGMNCTAFLGGIAKNYNSNFLPGNPAAGDAVVVVEADEYDRSFLTLNPDLSVITSMDADHLDIYGDKKYMEDSYRMFAQKLKKDGKLFYRQGLPLTDLASNHASYSVKSSSDYSASSIRIENHRYYFDWTNTTSTISGLTSDLPGWHNVENSVVAIAIAKHLGLTDEQITEGMKSYSGVRRRFDIQVRTENLVYIDDYAHHPEELRACISSARELYPGKRIAGIFQPHLFSRTRDFADGFANSLSLLDDAILLDIYPARELPISGVNSNLILDKMSLQTKMLCRKEDVLSELKQKSFDVLLTLGAGDIDQLVIPIRDYLINSYTKPRAHEV
ncbi:MAG: UDP-N-acetylmuramate--L-alanine ligase [Bacteroidia bacterium]|nr:UDP-N-acetylmuramate--L-alanine ligase [Bacteroidia bacterium]